MIQFTQIIVTLAAGLFTGAAIYINLAEHPARMECGTELAVTVFGPSYKRAARMQVFLIIVSTLGGLAAWLISGRLLWLIGAILIGAVIPFTLIAMMPTNKKLLDPTLDRKASSIDELLTSWGKLHAVRSLLGLAATLTFLYLNSGT